MTWKVRASFQVHSSYTVDSPTCLWEDPGFLGGHGMTGPTISAEVLHYKIERTRRIR
jgi:hypothetical protein